MANKAQIVILAAGESSRFYPFNTTHKSFFSIAGKSILQMTIENIIKKLATEVIIVLNYESFEKDQKFIEMFGFGEKIKCVPQVKPLGQADSILSAKKYLRGNFFVINPQQINLPEYYKSFINSLNSENSIAVVGSCETSEPQKYGILEFKGDKITGVIEKPSKDTAPSNKRIVGIYLFNKNFLEELEKTPISYYSLEETLNRIASIGKLSTVDVDDYSPSIKYPWDIFSFKDEFLSSIKKHTSKTAKVAKTAILRGEVYIDDNATIYDFAIIDGPAYIGKKAVVGSFCQVRGGAILEEGAEIARYVDVKNSYIGSQTHIHSGFVGDSIIGKNVRIGAGFITANKRIDRSNIRVYVNNEKVDTLQNNIGVFIGDNAKLGINVSTMPGSIIGANMVIYPSQMVKGTLKKKGENND